MTNFELKPVDSVWNHATAGSSADGQIDPDEPLMAESLKDEIRQSLDTLKDRERQVIKMYFGIDRDYAMHMEHIAEELNVTGERARQLVRQGECALRKVKGIEKLLQYL